MATRFPVDDRPDRSEMNPMRRTALRTAMGIAPTAAAGCRDDPDLTTVPPLPMPVPSASPRSPAVAAKLHTVAPELGLTIENDPSVNGSTSTQPILMMTACKILATDYAWVHAAKDDSRLLAKPHGTDRAYVNLIQNDCHSGPAPLRALDGMGVQC